MTYPIFSNVLFVVFLYLHTSVVFKDVSRSRGHPLGPASLISPALRTMSFNHGDLTFEELRKHHIGDMVWLHYKQDKKGQLLKSCDPKDYSVFAIMGRCSDNLTGAATLILWDFSLTALQQALPREEMLNKVVTNKLCSFVFLVFMFTQFTKKCFVHCLGY